MGSRRRNDLLDHVLREVPSVLDRLSDEDKASLAATRWSTLEAVLRGCRAVLKVHRDDPALQVLARRMEEGPCRGEVAMCGVRVAATDAGLLLEAARKVAGDLPDVANHPTERNRRWINLAWALTCEEEDGEARVTGLSVPGWSCAEHATMELASVVQIFASPPAREHLRRLSMALQHARQPLTKGRIELLTKAMRGLSALQHLELTAPPTCCVHLMGEYSRLTTLKLANIRLSPGETRALLDGLERARQLRHLRLHRFNLGMEAETTTRAPPAGLEVLDLVSSTCPYDLRDGTRLRALELRGMQVPWEEVAALMRRSKELRRVTLDSSRLDAGSVCAVFSALERSTVEVFDCAWSFDDEAEEETCSALTEALVSALRNNTTLLELALDFDSEEPDDLFLDVPKVAAALKDNTTLRRLKLHSIAVRDSDVAAIGEALANMRSLEELDLASGLMSGKGLRLEDSYLRVLRLRRAWAVGDEGVREVMRSLSRRRRVQKVDTLQISDSEITDKGAKHVAAALKERGCTLRTLSLANMPCNEVCIGDEGAAAIADALRHNRSLVSLNLSGNRLTDRGQESLAAALADNTTLRHLDASGCDGGSVRARDMLYAQRYAIGMRQMCARSTFRI